MMYQKPRSSWWTGRPSEEPQSIYQHISLLDLNHPPQALDGTRIPALLGYCCDAGVKRNQGRPGSSEGPAAIRNALGRMPLLRTGVSEIADAGNIRTKADMEAAQEGFATHVGSLLQAGYFPIGLGGGHDISFAHYQGLRRVLPPKTRLGIVNFDAHLDLRRPEPNPHSGSPFFQIAMAEKALGHPFEYLCIGARADANSQELWDRAAALGARVILRDTLSNSESVQKQVHAFMQQVDALYITIDLDGFSSAFAPGVSAASPMGFAPWEVRPLLQWLWESGKVVSMDLAEMNPMYDTDGQTARLAASLIHEVLHSPGLG